MAISNHVKPQVLAAMISAELPNKIKFAPFAKIDTTLVAQPGNTISVPKFAYVGDAATVAEYAAMGAAELSSTKADYTVKKAGKAIKLSDEEILSGYGDPVGEAGKQVVMAIAGLVDGEFVAELDKATLTSGDGSAALDHVAVANALKLFGENDEQKVLFVNPNAYAELLKQDAFIDASKYGQNTLFSGEIGQILGVRVVKSAKVASGKAFIMVPGAVTIFMKREAQVEADRDALAGTEYVIANQHYVVALTDATKVVELSHNSN